MKKMIMLALASYLWKKFQSKSDNRDVARHHG